MVVVEVEVGVVVKIEVGVEGVGGIVGVVGVAGGEGGKNPAFSMEIEICHQSR